MGKTGKKTDIEPQEWTVTGFLNEFMRIHKTMEDRVFCFVLGAGASVTSGISDGGSLANKWLKEQYTLLEEDPDSVPFEKWATTTNLGIPGFDFNKTASFYSQIYDSRFKDDPESGYAYLENEMKDAEPNIGYSILAQILEETRHKVIVTTNFDNLVADALSIYTNTFPLVCGHESLAGFVKLKLRRPLIAKIHRDLLLAPQSSTEGTSRLDERWAKVLTKLLEEYTPIVLGYGGNDGSLMDFLESLDSGKLQSGIYWCYRPLDGRPEEKIRKLVKKHKGKIIPIVGFDEFMLQLGDLFGYRHLEQKIDIQAKARVKRYGEQMLQFSKNIKLAAKDAKSKEVIKPVQKALADAVEREDSWWAWELKASEEKDPIKREQIYRKGLKHYPESPELTGNFALFLENIKKDYDEAEKLFRRALELDPNNATIAGNFASFLEDIKEDYDEAEKLYRYALELDPENPTLAEIFKIFMKKRKKN